jgi:hypothetical protein
VALDSSALTEHLLAFVDGGRLLLAGWGTQARRRSPTTLPRAGKSYWMPSLVLHQAFAAHRRLSA